MQDLVPLATIESLVRDRDQIVEDAMEAARRSWIAQKRMQKCYNRWLTPNIVLNIHDKEGWENDHRKKVEKEVDSAMWYHVLNVTGIFAALDSKRASEFTKQIEKDPPKITVEMIQGTLVSLAAQSGNIFSDSVLDLWKWLHPRYKTHQELFTNKWIVKVRYSDKWYSISRDEINKCYDIDKALAKLDGKPQPQKFQEGLSLHLNNVKSMSVSFETEYWSAKLCANGNLHLKTKRPDLIEKLNQILIEKNVFLSST